MLVLATIMVLILNQTGTSEAIGNAAQATRLVARATIEPNLSDSLADSDRSALDEFDGAVRPSVVRDPVVRIKIWTPDGRVAYSDEPRLIGSRFAVDDHQDRALRTGQAIASLTDLNRPENRYELALSRGQLLEVYLRVHTPSGRTLLYENYMRFDAVQEAGLQIWSSFVPAVFATLLVMELLQLSLAWSLTRRIQENESHRARLLKRVIDMSELERRRIAQELNEGSVNELMAASLSLAATSRRLRREGQAEAAAVLDEAAAETRKSVHQLRTLSVDIYPSNLHEEGIEAALSNLLSPLDGRGITSSLEVQPELRLAPETEKLLYRTAREAIRNVAAHAHARSMEVRIAVDGGRVALTVRDDGRGLDVSTLSTPAPGHLGLRLMADIAQDAGGSFKLTSAAGKGTEIRVELPAN
jgi:signal transduction histidine kinase